LHRYPSVNHLLKKKLYFLITFLPFYNYSLFLCYFQKRMFTHTENINAIEKKENRRWKPRTPSLMLWFEKLGKCCYSIWKFLRFGKPRNPNRFWICDLKVCICDFMNLFVFLNHYVFLILLWFMNMLKTLSIFLVLVHCSKSQCYISCSISFSFSFVLLCFHINKQIKVLYFSYCLCSILYFYSMLKKSILISLLSISCWDFTIYLCYLCVSTVVLVIYLCMLHMGRFWFVVVPIFW